MLLMQFFCLINYHHHLSRSIVKLVEVFDVMLMSIIEYMNFS